MKKHESLITLPTTIDYITIPRSSVTSPIRIDELLEQRMKEFMLSRRRVQWKELGY